ncbi:MAG: hypothetical protein HUU45_12190 [Leptospiraceae bacterium]|nr:hypothetical protein [Leptospiraceae bacterium]
MDNLEFINFKRQTEKDLKSLRRKNFFLLLIIVSGITYFTLTGFNSKNTVFFDSIKTKELIVVDNNGNERIIISPMISSTKTRTRTDTLSGVLVLDENGNDRVILGASPNVNINGKIVRRATNGPYGLAFNDENGVEKGGIGYYSDKRLSVLGLDGPSGEGIVLFVPEKELFGQKAGIIINDPQAGGQLFYIGANTKGERIINMDVQNKGRFSFEMDTTPSAKISFYDYFNNKEKILLKSNKK